MTDFRDLAPDVFLRIILTDFRFARRAQARFAL
jgi:hypothetical protein